MKVNTKALKRTLKAKSLLIFTVVGLVGMTATVATAIKATPKAIDHIKEAEEKKGESLTKIEVIQTCWKDYIPTAIMGATSVICVTAAQHQNAKENAAIASACTIGAEAYQNLASATEKVVGPEKMGEIAEQMATDANEKALKKIQVEKKEPVIERSDAPRHQGITHCYDPAIDREFWSDITKIKKAIMDVNLQLAHGSCDFVTLNDFYDELGLDHIKDIGNYIGWTDNYRMDVSFSSMLREDSGEPLLVMIHRNPPRTYSDCRRY